MLNELLARYPALSACRDALQAAPDLLEACFRRGGTLLLCGNGGSAADCDHIAGELLKGFRLPRPVADHALPEDLRARLQGGLPAISLHSASAAFTACLNDLDPEIVYAQLLYALGRPGDVLLGISTSGNAANVCAAARLARAMGIGVIALTGAAGGRLAPLADAAIRVPETETYRVQEMHLPVYHYLCAEVERRFFA